MIIPHQEVPKETLRRLIEDFVSREGTDNGYDQTLEDKVQQVHAQLTSGELVVVFDFSTDAVNILPAESAKAFEVEFNTP